MKASNDAGSKPAEQITAYKGFNKDLSCRGFQYEFGKIYEHKGPPVRCGAPGFHSCEHPLDIFSYYPPEDGNRFAEVTVAGEIDRAVGEDTKIASAKITINMELSLGELTRRAVKWVAEKAKQQGNGQHASGNYGHASAAGYRGHASAAGEGGHAEVKGTSSVAASLGLGGTATAVAGSAIALAAYDDNVWPPKLVAVRSSMVGENGVEAGKKYRLTKGGDFEEAA